MDRLIRRIAARALPGARYANSGVCARSDGYSIRLVSMLSTGLPERRAISTACRSLLSTNNIALVDRYIFALYEPCDPDAKRAALFGRSIM